jgi:NAD(P)-dependent dehydrogenase (short-subunit alcohol dehydrogenase family)
MSVEISLKGKVAVVTGGTRGLGRAVAHGLAQAGATVVVASRKPEACAAATEELSAATGAQVGWRALHVGRWAEIAEVVDSIYDEYGSLDVLVNNAGIAPVADDLGAVSEELYDKTLDVNLKGPFRLMAVVGPRMVAAGDGSIINVTSIAAVRPSPLELPYATAKAGLNAAAAGFAQELAPTVRVNTVMPGPFATDMSATWDDDLRNRVVGSVPMRRLGEPDELVGAVLYFASDLSRYATGAVLAVDGGRTAVA